MDPPRPRRRRRRRPNYSFNLSSILIALTFTPLRAAAQNWSFTWGFSALEAGQTNLVECQSYELDLDLTRMGTNPLAQAPYYFMAYPANGVPTVTPLGDDIKKMKWAVDFPSGSSLLLQIVDANGNSGGVDIPIYKVTPGNSSSCHANPVDPPITLSTSTTHLNTCDPWVLDVAGGAPPYKVSVVANNASFAINATMGDRDNRYTWYMRAVPSESTVVLAAVSDKNGVYAKSSSIIGISGSDDIRCPGLNSSGSLRTDPPSTKKTNLPLIIGASVGGAAALLLLLLFTYFIHRRRRRHADTAYHEEILTNAMPTPFRITGSKNNNNDRLSLDNDNDNDHEGLVGRERDNPYFPPSSQPNSPYRGESNAESLPFLVVGREKRPGSGHTGHSGHESGEFNPYDMSSGVSGSGSGSGSGGGGGGGGRAGGRDSKQALLRRDRERDRDSKGIRNSPSNTSIGGQNTNTSISSPSIYTSASAPGGGLGTELSSRPGSSGYPPLPPGAGRGLMNPGLPLTTNSSSSNSRPTSRQHGVIVHQDYGPIIATSTEQEPADPENPPEIPPAYENIRHGSGVPR